MCFNDEGLARAIAACPVPVVTGIATSPTPRSLTWWRTGVRPPPRRPPSPWHRRSTRWSARCCSARCAWGRAMSTLVAARRQRVDAAARLMAGGMDAQLSPSPRGARRPRRPSLPDRPARPGARPGSPTSCRPSSACTTRSRARWPVTPSAAGSPRGAFGPRASACFARPRRRSGVSRPRSTRSSPLSVLARGYAITRDADGRVVKDASELAPGDEVRVLLGRGSIDATVSNVNDHRAERPERGETW